MEITFRKYFIKNRKKPGMNRDGLRKFSAGLILSALLALLLAFPVPASANSPSDVQLTYLDKEQTLQVRITHKSFVPNSHYIAKVEIQKNSEKPLVYEYKSQSDKEAFTYTYKLPLNKGDRVDVNVICNLFGSRSSSMIYAGPKTR
ncbi:MAG: hypothetical protein ABRQ32_06535 [Smithellaceae bacterium]|jgi:hypothetical protein